MEFYAFRMKMIITQIEISDFGTGETYIAYYILKKVTGMSEGVKIWGGGASSNVGA